MKTSLKNFLYIIIAIQLLLAVAISPVDEARYIMTASQDRYCKFWDLNDTSTPLSTSFKGLVTDGLWLSHWPAAVISYDDVYS